MIRCLLILAALAVFGAPTSSRAQQPALPVIGFITLSSQEGATGFITAFRKGLSESGFVEGRDVVIEYRFARNESARLKEWAADFARRPVAVIVTYGYAGAFAAKAATTTVPIVFFTSAARHAKGSPWIRPKP